MRAWHQPVKNIRHLILGGAVALSISAGTTAEIIEDVLVSATRDARSTHELAAAIGRIDGDVIDSVGHTHIEEVAGRVPGVWISRGNGQEHLTAIRSGVLTGPGSCGAFYMAEDGIPLRAPGFCNVNQLFDANTEQAGAIEILRGPGTAVHGSNAVNGVVNVLAAMPDDSGSRISIEHGRHDYNRIKLDYNAAGDAPGTGLRVTANSTSDGGFKEDSGFDQQKITLRHVRDGDVWQTVSGVTATNLNQETAGYVYGKDAYKDKSRRDENPNPEAYRDSSSVRVFSRFTRNFDGDRQLLVTPFLRYTEMRFLQHFLPTTPLEENRHYSAGLQSAVYQATAFGRLHYGFDIDISRGLLEESQTAATRFSFPTGQHYDYEVDAVNLAWFTGILSDIGADTRLDADLRYEIQDYRYDNKISDGNSPGACAGTCRYARPADRDDRFHNLSVSLGLIHDLNDSHQLVARAAQGFRAPQAAELYRLQSTQLDADLDSEELSSLEFSLRNHFSAAHLNITAYWMEKHNVIIQNSDQQNLSDGKTRHRGIEIDGAAQLTDTLKFTAQGSVARHQYANDVFNVEGNDVDSAPRRMASAQFIWQPRAASSVEIEWRHTGAYFLDASNSHRYDGHKLVNIRWREQLSDAVYIGARMINLEDRSYAERADFDLRRDSERYFIGEPRSVFAEIGFRFN